MPSTNSSHAASYLPVWSEVHLLSPRLCSESLIENIPDRKLWFAASKLRTFTRDSCSGRVHSRCWPPLRCKCLKIVTENAMDDLQEVINHYATHHWKCFRFCREQLRTPLKRDTCFIDQKHTRHEIFNMDMPIARDRLPYFGFGSMPRRFKANWVVMKAAAWCSSTCIWSSSDDWINCQ